MSLPSAEDMLWAAERMAGMGINTRCSLAKFRDGVHIDVRQLSHLEALGYLAAMPDGTWMALPGVIEAFTERFGPGPHNVELFVRSPESNHRAKNRLFEAVSGAVGFKAAGKAPRQTNESARVVAVPAARVEGVHPGDWGGVRRGLASGRDGVEAEAEVNGG